MGDFVVMPSLIGLPLDQFGHNMLTTDVEGWTKQRKIIAGVTDKCISKSIVDATICHTAGMLDRLLNTGTEETFESGDLSQILAQSILRIVNHINLIRYEA